MPLLPPLALPRLDDFPPLRLDELEPPLPLFPYLSEREPLSERDLLSKRVGLSEAFFADLTFTFLPLVPRSIDLSSNKSIFLSS
ncbi:MAG: hypothetical protein VXX73_02705, partial [Pseudomonadota bacterium]|nr:hypothetical protein [Pseudomonadota bacterium]